MTSRRIFHRHGLMYGPLGDTGLLHYQPDRPFTVDGIRYTSLCAAIRTMIQLIDTDSGGGAHMNHHTPPTDAELDLWVKEGARHDYLHHH